MARDKKAQLRNLITGYGDSIRLSDIKAMIAVLFVAIMLGTVIQFRAQYPWYLSVPTLLMPFLMIFLNLLISIYPRFPRAGQRRFPIWRNPDPENFNFLTELEDDVEGLAATCAILSNILWWKNVTLQTAYVLSMACLAAAAVLLFVGWA
jgi:hypothetical protein